MTLRDFIKSLERLSENGKYGDVPVLVTHCDEYCVDIDRYGIDDIYPLYEIEDGNPINGKKCLIIQM